jgi:hypothetical protein
VVIGRWVRIGEFTLCDSMLSHIKFGNRPQPNRKSTNYCSGSSASMRTMLDTGRAPALSPGLIIRAIPSVLASGLLEPTAEF